MRSRLTDPAGETLTSDLTGSYDRDNLLANLIEHRGNPAVRLIADVSETGGVYRGSGGAPVGPIARGDPAVVLRMAAGRIRPACGGHGRAGLDPSRGRARADLHRVGRALDPRLNQSDHTVLTLSADHSAVLSSSNGSTGAASAQARRIGRTWMRIGDAGGDRRFRIGHLADLEPASVPAPGPDPGRLPGHRRTPGRPRLARRHRSCPAGRERLEPLGRADLRPRRRLPMAGRSRPDRARPLERTRDRDTRSRSSPGSTAGAASCCGSAASCAGDRRPVIAGPRSRLGSRAELHAQHSGRPRTSTPSGWAVPARTGARPAGTAGSSGGSPAPMRWRSGHPDAVGEADVHGTVADWLAVSIADR